MNRIEKWMFQVWVGRALSRRSDSALVPLVGPDVDSVNCFAVYIANRPKWYAVVDRIEAETVFASYHQDGAATEHEEFLLESLDPQTVVVQHFRGIWRFEFRGLWSFVRGQVFRLPYLLNFWVRLRQAMANRQSLERVEQMQLLRLLLEYTTDRALNAGSRGLTVFNIFAVTQGDHFWQHPERDRWMEKVRLHLDAFEEFGWAAKGDRESRFTLTGKGLAEIERRDEEERKHRSAQFLQWTLVALTVVAAFAAIVQAAAAVYDATKQDASGRQQPRPPSSMEVPRLDS